MLDKAQNLETANNCILLRLFEFGTVKTTIGVKRAHPKLYTYQEQIGPAVKSTIRGTDATFVLHNDIREAKSAPFCS